MDKALQRRTVSLASDPQHVLPVRQAGEELADFEDRLRDWAEKFLQTLSGDKTQLSPDLQKETAWATFESFVTLITEITLIGVALSLSFKEKYFAYKELLADLKSRSLEPADFVVGVKFWSLLPEEIKALAHTKPKKQVRGTGDPVSVKHSWKYMQEVIEEAMATLDQKHTRLEWVASVSSGVLRLCSSSDTSVKKREIKVSKYHNDGAHDSTSRSSGASLEQLIVATDLSRDIQSMDPERVQMLTNFSRKWSEKMKGSGSGNIGRSNNRKNRQQRQQQSHQRQQQFDDKQQSQSSQSLGQKGRQSLSKADIDSIASTMLKMQEDKKKGDSSRKTANFKMTQEKVRMAVTSCEAETNEAIRYGGGFVDMVFEQPPAWIQSLPIVEYFDAELEEDAPAVEGKTDTKETERGQQGERRIFNMSNPADQEAWMARFANCM